MTVAHDAARNGLVQMLDVLEHSEPRTLGAADKDGLTPFLTACACGQISVIDWLLNKRITNGHDIEPKTGATGLHLATVRHHTNAVTFLVTRVPALVLATTNDHATAIRIAAEAGYLDVVTVLLNHGADPTQSDDSGMSALTAAEYYGRMSVASLIHTRLPSKTCMQAGILPPQLLVHDVTSPLADDLQNPMPVLGLEASALDMDTPLDLASLTAPQGLERMSMDFNMALPPMDGVPNYQDPGPGWTGLDGNPTANPPTLKQREQQEQQHQPQHHQHHLHHLHQHHLHHQHQQHQQHQQYQLHHAIPANAPHTLAPTAQPSLGLPFPSQPLPLDPQSHPAALRTIRHKSSFEDPDSPMSTIPLSVPDLKLEDVDGLENPALDAAFLISQFADWPDNSSVHSNDLDDSWFSDKEDGLPTRGNDLGSESNASATSSAAVSRNNSVGSHLVVPAKRKPGSKRQGKKLYVCTYCQKNFSCSSNKKRHERVHSGGKGPSMACSWQRHTAYALACLMRACMY